MPVIIPEKLPATKVLKDQGIFVIDQNRAVTQDIRPLRVCILNLMPDKITTETHLLSKLGNNIIHVEITLITMENHVSKNTAQSHLDSFYSYFKDIRHQFFDALIITGAPIEHIAFEEVGYWAELQEIFAWSRTNVYSSLFICWASQSALYYFYGIEKEAFDQKLFGVYPHIKEDPKSKLFLGMDDMFYVPHSRGTCSNEASIRQEPALSVLASSPQAGVHLVASKDGRQLFMSGHPEYGTDTLQKEYLRDLNNPNVAVPAHYFQDDDPQKQVLTSWKSDGSLFYNNWLNYYIYQETEYLLDGEPFQH